MNFDDEDRDGPAGPGRPTYEEARREQARRGDYQALLGELDKLERVGLPGDAERIWKLVLEACRAGSRDDPAGFGRRALDELVSFVMCIKLRVVRSVRGKLAAADRDRATLGLPGPEAEVDLGHTEGLFALQGHLVTLVEARASVERKWALARRGGPGERRDGSDKTAGEGAEQDRADRDGHDGRNGQAPVNGHAVKPVAAVSPYDRLAPGPGDGTDAGTLW